MGLLIYQFVLAHVVCDFVLQSSSMARGKNRHIHIDRKEGGSHSHVFWPYWLTAHSFVHGGAVWLITGSVILGLTETCLHWIIDFAKCERWTNIHIDQSLHLACKAMYLFII